MKRHWLETMNVPVMINLESCWDGWWLICQFLQCCIIYLSYCTCYRGFCMSTALFSTCSDECYLQCCSTVMNHAFVDRYKFLSYIAVYSVVHVFPALCFHIGGFSVTWTPHQSSAGVEIVLLSSVVCCHHGCFHRFAHFSVNTISDDCVIFLPLWVFLNVDY